MSQIYTFHKTVRGYLHKMNEIPCEDSSTSFSSEEGQYFIAVVADGHGSESCFRSSGGSKIAVDTALECLQQFAKAALASNEIENRFYIDMFTNPRYCQMRIKQLTDTIIAKWNDRVLEDYKNNPPTLQEMGENAAEYASGKNVGHIYGTTLIAALQLPKCLLLIHQGDGRCDVFYSDGTIDQPIPWDPKCEDTVTTSLCDTDAAERIRSCVINLTEKPVMACYLGCDGVEDAYRDTYEGLGGSHVLMGGVHTFYKDLSYWLANLKQKDFENYLETMLPKFSADGRFSHSGSGDDVSVAGIVNIDVIRNFVEKFQYDVKLYELEENLFWKEDELRGKVRKHGILQKRVDESHCALEEAEKEQQLLKQQLQRLKKDRDNYLQEVEQKKAELDMLKNEYQDIETKLGSGFKLLFAEIQVFIRKLVDRYSDSETDYQKMLKELSRYENQIKEIEEKKDINGKKVEELKKKWDEAQSVYEEYNAKYKAIDDERIHIENEIAALREENQK